ncbi:MAG: hypothetical protein ACK4HQ_03415 [Brevinematales bacterium]
MKTSFWKARLLARHVYPLKATTESFLTAKRAEYIFLQWKTSARPLCKV